MQEYVSRALITARKAEGIFDVPQCLTTIGNVYELTHCPDDPSLPCNGIKFIPSSDVNSLSCNEIYLDTTDPLNLVLKENLVGYPERTLLSSQMKIKYVRFIINGDKSKRIASLGDVTQPRITMLFDVKTPASPYQQEKIIQTTVSQRNLNK